MNLKRFIFEALNTKFEGIGEKALNRVAAIAVKTIKTEEDATAYVEGLTLQQIVDSYADSRASEATEKGVTNYEKKHGLKDGEKIQANNGNDDGGDGEGNGETATRASSNGKSDEMPAYMKGVLSKLDNFSSELATLKGEKITSARSSKLSGLLKDAPEKLRNRYAKDFSRMKFETDDEFEEWLEEITPDIEDISTTISAKEGVVGKPKGGAKATGEESKVNPLVQNRVDARKAETETPAIIGLTIK